MAYITFAKTLRTPPHIAWILATVCEMPRFAQYCEDAGRDDMTLSAFGREWARRGNDWKELFAQTRFCATVPKLALRVGDSRECFEFNVWLVRIISHQDQSRIAQILMDICETRSVCLEIWHALARDDCDAARYFITSRTLRTADISYARDIIMFFGKLDLHRLIENDPRLFAILGDSTCAALGGSIDGCAFARAHNRYTVRFFGLFRNAIIGGHPQVCDFAREWFNHMCDDADDTYPDVEVVSVGRARDLRTEWVQLPARLMHFAIQSKNRAMCEYLLLWQLEICDDEQIARDLLNTSARLACMYGAYWICDWLALLISARDIVEMRAHCTSHT